MAGPSDKDHVVAGDSDEFGEVARTRSTRKVVRPYSADAVAMI